MADEEGQRSHGACIQIEHDVKAKRQFRRNKKHFVNMNPSIELENDQDMFGKDFMMRNENVSSIYRVHERERRVINEKERHQNQQKAKFNREMRQEENRNHRVKELKHWDNYREAK